MKLKLKHEYLNDENERSDGAKILADRYRHLQSARFNISIGPFLQNIEEQIEKYIRSKVMLKEYRIQKTGFIFKKLSIHATTTNIEINETNMLVFVGMIYDLILSYNIKSEILPLDPGHEL